MSNYRFGSASFFPHTGWCCCTRGNARDFFLEGFWIGVRGVCGRVSIFEPVGWDPQEGG